MKFLTFNSSLFALLTIFSASCKNECQKLSLSKSEKKWVAHFKQGDISLFKNSNGQTDTMVVTETRDFYTPCNQIELSKYQFEVNDVSFKLRSKSVYNNAKSMIVFKRSSYEQRIPYIYFGNLGPFQKNIDNKSPVSVDTVLRGNKFTNVYYYGKELNMEQYGENIYFKNFFWSEDKGLIAYTTVTDELFLRTVK
jgi:hypothetical protein